ncbi:hypothetical protein [Paludisphaera soli]|uniref:hypothetical protein n=1 Tax=Paludisphaera soli TaxID=2712865 RepID=UPI0013EDF1C3|nr:hypothetical protein [Paludisphaera soli]
MILRWAFAGASEYGEPMYRPADAASRRAAADRLGAYGFKGLTRAQIHDASRADDRHAWPLAMGYDDAVSEPSQVACNRCNVGRRLGVHPCRNCGSPEYRMLEYIED